MLFSSLTATYDEKKGGESKAENEEEEKKEVREKEKEKEKEKTKIELSDEDIKKFISTTSLDDLTEKIEEILAEYDVSINKDKILENTRSSAPKTFLP